MASKKEDAPAPLERSLLPSQPMNYLHKLCLWQQARIRFLQTQLRENPHWDDHLVVKFFFMCDQHEALRNRIRRQAQLLNTTAHSLVCDNGQPPSGGPAATTPTVDIEVLEIREQMRFFPGDFAKVDWELMEELLGPDPNGADAGEFPVPDVIELSGDSSDAEGNVISSSTTGMEEVKPVPAQRGGRGQKRGRGRGRGRGGSSSTAGKPPAAKAKCGNGKK